ncbi:MAG: hypothetical protein GY757_24645 [bacterium]|nr:hypothetical protein [bacterium]
MEDARIRNDRAAERINEIYNAFTVTLEEGDRPGTREEVEQGWENLKQAREAEPDDPELIAQMNETEEILKDSELRKFTGSKWFIIGIGLYLLAYLAILGGGKLFIEADIARTEKVREMKIRMTEKTILTMEKRKPTTQLQKAARQDRIAEAKDALVMLKKMTPEEFRSHWKTEQIYNGIRFIITKLPMVLLLILYYYVSRPKQYTINRRKKEMEVVNAGASKTKKIILAILGYFISMRITWYVTRYTDGTSETSSDALIVLFLKVIGPILLFMLVVYTMIVVLPFIVVINYLRNYQFEKFDVTISKYIDKFLGYFAKTERA